MSIRSMLMIIAAMFLILGCGSGSGGGGEGATPDPTGLWATDCQQKGLSSEKTVVEFDGFQRTVTTYQYGSFSCEAGYESFAMADTRSYTVGGDSAHSTTEIDYTLVSFIAVGLSADGVESLNEQKTLGYDDWTLGGKKRLDGTDTVPQAGTKFYSVFKIEGSNLFLGDHTIKDGATADSRPTTLKSTTYIMQ